MPWMKEDEMLSKTMASYFCSSEVKNSSLQWIQRSEIYIKDTERMLIIFQRLKVMAPLISSDIFPTNCHV